MRIRGLALVAVTTGALLVLGPARAASAVLPNELAGILAAIPDPSAPPPGVDDYACRLSAAHPRPVVLIPGTFANMEDDYGALGPLLAGDGYCVFSTNYGGPPGRFIQSTGPVAASAQAVADFVGRVSRNYGGSQVDLVGHSQGGMIAEYIAKVLGGAPELHTIVALSPTSHGTTLDGLTSLAPLFPGANQLVGAACAACRDQEQGSTLIRRLDTGAIAQPGLTYTVIETRYEYVVTPVGSSFVREPGVTNEYVQSFCALDLVEHTALTYDNTTIRLILNALDPADMRRPNCFETFPFPALQQ
jgi:triacylglycerol esterase/lipase EstA (alpha/beta hydrolase family)